MARLWSNLFRSSVGRWLPSSKSLSGKALMGIREADEGSAGKVPKRRALVKDRPASLEQRYAILDHAALADEVFLRLKQQLFTAIDSRRSGPTVFREAGRLAPGRPYFYLKPANQTGWLCERSGAGWLLTPAEKIVGRDLFLRGDEPIDSVVLYMAQDRVVMPRVRSQLLGDDLVALAVYEQKLLHQLGLA